MSGAVAAHAAYNGSGTQGLAVTNKINDDDGDVMSVFWNKNDTTRQLLYGSSIIEIPASGSGGNLTSGGNQVFTVNNDVDGLGDLYLQITTSEVTEDIQISDLDLLSCIKRIDFMVGTQVWQTLETNDILALNTTELSEDSFESFTLAMSGGFNKSGTRRALNIEHAYNTADSTKKLRQKLPSKTNCTGVFRVPMLSRSVGPKLAKFVDITENTYMLAGAPHQNVKVRVYMAGSLPATMIGKVAGFNLRLFGQCVIMCNEEREQIKAMPTGLPKRLKMTQNATKKESTALATPAPGASGDGGGSDGRGGVQTVNLDLDHFSLFASHIILCVKGGDFVDNCSIATAELKLNSSSFSGTLEGGLLTGPVADALGLYSNGVYIDGINLTDNFYVFPLASHAYGGSSVPLNRFDNIRMELNVFSKNRTSGTPGQITISATCVGETTALFKGGAASLAMY